jgi:hypothetical protein
VPYGLSGIVDQFGYSGAQNRKSLLKWRNLTASTSSMALIPNLIWTDQVANMLVGTKSLLNAIPSGIYPVRMNHRRITYDFRYGIPAFLLWLIWLAVVTLALWRLLDKHGRERLHPTSLRILINKLTVGRALVELENSGLCETDAPTNEWLDKAGGTLIDLSDSKRLPGVESSDGAEEVN